jgi:hypothetical protein
LITKINGQRYLGLPKKDTKGQDYWRYKFLPNPEQSGAETKFDEQQTEFRSNQNSALPNNVAKFNQRQEQVKNYDQSNSVEKSVNS